MKVLFVCHQNVGRSQMAKAFYNDMTTSNEADSAGTHVIEVGQTLDARKQTSSSHNFFVIDVMTDVGIDISNYIRTPLSQELEKNYDLIVSMAAKEDTPKWLLQSPKYLFWDIKDPRGQDFENTAKVRDEIKSRVNGLLNPK